MKYNTAMNLPGGWAMEQPDGTVVKGHTYQMMIEAIAEHRLRLGIPMGDIVAEFHAYACKKYPEYSYKEPKDYGYPGAEIGLTDIFHRVTVWISGMKQRMPRGGYPVISEAKAASRMEVCMACPRSHKFTCGCGSDQRVRLELNRLAYPRATSPGGIVDRACAVTGWGCSVACNLDVAASQADTSNVPDNCWVKKEASAS